MCLILIGYDCHPRYKLIFAGNRDELYARPTSPAAFWADAPDILGGRDLVTCGTWTGITKEGRLAAVTAYREPSNLTRHFRPRGPLAADFLRGDEPAPQYMQRLVERSSRFKGFSLLAGTVDSLYYLSNRENVIQRLEKGLHGLSNNLLDVPWPKVTKALQSMEVCLQSDEVQVDDLFAIMADRVRPDDRDLPDTGVGIEIERIVSSAFVSSPTYGTRAMTIIMVDRGNQVQFWEHSLESANPANWHQVYYEFQV
jgi:uncharacterized protein with NRDE domain